MDPPHFVHKEAEDGGGQCFASLLKAITEPDF